jgi:putative phosphotransacetylase
MSNEVQIGLSNKHLHLRQEDVDTLFGKGHQLTHTKDLIQPGQYACDEKVDIVGPKGVLKGVRVLGPVRPETQVELALTDARAIGLKVPVRESGKLDGTPGCKLIGPAGEVELEKGVIAALRHVHLNPAQAEALGVKDKDIVCVRVNGERAITFENVLVRAGDAYFGEIHLDTDEGNAAGLGPDAMGTIIKE